MNNIRMAVSMVIIAHIVHAQGSVMLVGGGAENFNRWSDEPYGWFVAEADSGIVINIDVGDASDWYPDYFVWLGADSASHGMRIATRAQANDQSVYEELVEADAIFIEGGDQWDYVYTWKGTLVEDAIHEVFARGGAIGGTSAGLAILGEVVFDARHGTAYPDEVAYDPYDYYATLTDDFISILPNVITDSHFHGRGRLGRLVPFIARRIQDHGQANIMGIGVEEKTAFCIDPDETGTVYGEYVTIVSGTEQSEILCVEDIPITFTHVLCDQLLHEAVYDLRERRLMDPGRYLEPLQPELPPLPQFQAVVLDGSDEAAAELGTIEITELDSDPDNWWYGDLGEQAGEDIVPRSAIIPRLWNDSDYFANRWIGGMLGVAMHERHMTIYLDDGCTATISSEGIFETDELAYLLNGIGANHIGISAYDMPGFVGCRLHFLGPGDSADLTSFYALDADEPTVRSEDFSISSVYPNPACSEIIVRFNINRNTDIDMTVYNVKGRLVRRLLTDFPTQQGKHVTQWNFADIPSGVYQIQIRVGDQYTDHPVVVIR